VGFSSGEFVLPGPVSNGVKNSLIPLHPHFRFDTLDALFSRVSKSCDFKISNAIALSTVIVARCRNKNVSAVAHQISAILIHSGV